MSEHHFVIVGGGVAGICAAKAIRDRLAEATISIYGNESGLPYNRVKLSKGLFTDLHSDKVLIKKEKWFRDNQIAYYPETPITSIDPRSNAILTGKEEQVKYDKLLLCTGATNRTLELEGASLPQVHHIRTRNDADQLKQDLQGGDSVCVIGGGIQGVETAWALFQAGHPVTIIEQASRLMARQLDEQASTILAERIQATGNEVRLGQAVRSIVGMNSVEGVELADGSIVPCVHVVYLIGVIPNVDLARQSGLDVNTGIIVNEQMQTSSQDIYAAGDAAECQGKVEGLWNSAMEQGRVAGTNMAGDMAVYARPIPMTVSGAFDMPLVSIGQVDEQQCDHSGRRSDTETYTRVFVRDGSICGAIIFDNVSAALPYKTAIEQGLSLAEAGLQVHSM